MPEGETFVNPYTFVPLPPSQPLRSAPHGHSGRGDLHSGKLAVTIEARTPLLLRNITRHDDGIPRLPQRPDGRFILPGSSLKGAFRALHETLTGSCFRVIDDEFVPTYRDSATPESIGDVLLGRVVRDEKDGLLKVQVCEKGDPRKHRLHQDDLVRIHEKKGLVSGARLRVTVDTDGKPVRGSAERDENGEWVVFISDSGARDPQAPYRAHIRRLTQKKVPISEEAWIKYRASIRGARDLSTANVEKRREGQLHTDVTPKPGTKDQTGLPVVGKRWLVSEELHEEQAIWVQLKGGEVRTIRHAMIWRHPGWYSTRDRLQGTGLLPCDDNESLCPSCQLFGSADVTSRGPDDAASQRSYRGHVRFGDAIADSEDIEPLPFEPAPMGMPRPGSGQFYLENDKQTVHNVAQPPLREWGAYPDQGDQPRRIRGRKYYWHTPLSDQSKLPRRAVARETQKDSEMVTSAVAFPKGTTFTATITFIDLDEVQLGSLMAVLQPRSVLADQVLEERKPCEILQHIGGGRPLGLGSCAVSIDAQRSQIWRSVARYGGRAESTTPTIDEYIERFRSWATDNISDVHDQWPLIATAMGSTTVPPDAVWYPPGASWATCRTDPKQFDDGYEFWTQTSGAEEATADSGHRTGKPLRPLPQLRVNNHALPIVTTAEATEITKPPHPNDPKGKRK